MSTTQHSFYLVIDHAIESAQDVIQAAISLTSPKTSVHLESYNDVSSLQVDTRDLVVATRIKLIYGSFIRYEHSSDA